MSIPVPIVECEGCQRRFGLTPQAFIEDNLLENEFPPDHGGGFSPGSYPGV